MFCRSNYYAFSFYLEYELDILTIQINFKLSCIYIFTLIRLQFFCANAFLAIYTITNNISFIKIFPKTVQGGVIDIPSDSATQDQDVLGLDNIERDGPTAIPSQVNYR